MLDSWKRIEIEESRDSERSFFLTITYDIAKYAIAANAAAIAFLSAFAAKVIDDPIKHGAVMLWAVDGIALFFTGLVTGCLGIAFLWGASALRIYYANKALSAEDPTSQMKHAGEFSRGRKVKAIAPLAFSVLSFWSFAMGVKVSIISLGFFAQFDIWHYLYIHLMPRF